MITFFLTSSILKSTIRMDAHDYDYLLLSDQDIATDFQKDMDLHLASFIEEGASPKIAAPEDRASPPMHSLPSASPILVPMEAAVLTVPSTDPLNLTSTIPLMPPPLMSPPQLPPPSLNSLDLPLGSPSGEPVSMVETGVQMKAAAPTRTPKPLPLANQPPFTAQHLDFIWATKGLPTRGLRRKRIWDLRAWFRSFLFPMFRALEHPNELQIGLLKKLRKGLHKRLVAKICSVVNCNNLYCSKEHWCSECAVHFGITTLDHQYGPDCVTYTFMEIALKKKT